MPAQAHAKHLITLRDTHDTVYHTARTRLDRRLHISLFLLSLAVTVACFPVSHASDELVKNGGFETSTFDNWDTANSRDVTHTPHSGKYSARIGTETTDGRIAQTVEIPPKSTAKFTAWYRVEKQSRLTISLKRSDGVVIWQKTVTDVSSWSPVTHELDLSYAGRPITVEFVGTGYGGSHIETKLVCDHTTIPPQCGYMQIEIPGASYWPYVDDVSLIYTVVAYETDVSIMGLPQRLSTKIFVDNTQERAVAGGGSVVLTFKIGETHRISTETFIYTDNKQTTRYYCADDSENVSSDGSITFRYTPQYYLSVNSQYGNVTASGWYDAGAPVAFSVDRSVPGPTGIDYLLVSWKTTHVFDGWTGDSSSTNPSGSVVMDGPKTITATWKTEKSYDYALLFAVIGICMVGILATYLVVSGRRTQNKEPLVQRAEIAAK